MASLGLGNGWECLFANDIDEKKAKAYNDNLHSGEAANSPLEVDDVGNLKTHQLNGNVDLAWASFPCQDLSLAGGGAGLNGGRSGTFWPFWELMQALNAEGRSPRLIVLENVRGAITSHGGKDFAAIGDALADGGYAFGGIVIDASLFLPQSRPRLFFVAVKAGALIPNGVVAQEPQSPWHTEALLRAQRLLSPASKDLWRWWTLPQPSSKRKGLSKLLEKNPNSVRWHTPEETQHILGLMSERNIAKVREKMASRERAVGTVYRRTRPGPDGRRVQRAEVRFDDVSGCLRTPAGGSSRQTLLIVEGEQVRSRLLSTREAARLMGLPKSYMLPERYNEAYHLVGDGVAVPVVRYLAAQLLEPLLAATTAAIAAE